MALGYIAFWNIYGRGRLFAYFSSSRERSTVSDVAVDDKDFLLYAGDQLGFLYIWNIAEYAINGPEAKPPVLLHSWNTHNCSITSISLMNEHQLLLTTSLDYNAKLWSLKGEYIGTFGQREPWNIKEKSSWGLSESNPSSETTSDSFGQESTRTFDTQKKSKMDAEMIWDTCTSKMVTDDELAEELKQRQIDRLHRCVQLGFKSSLFTDNILAHTRLT
ncbi:WD repeat-containing protein on Y chromosome-like [Podarcis raffonei]|uniref:WD repeat-containing protein on Y chromosome-like n=1 Tax=Podarcis raffonei TaxID=65483 RepID=UPI00232918D6|nr:WD repeat-containing protein on Y chromosome-like [Podarcis raffonei]